MSGELADRLVEEILTLRAELYAVRTKLEDIVIAQLGGPCPKSGTVETVLQVAERVSLGITRLNMDARRYHDERNEVQAAFASVLQALVNSAKAGDFDVGAQGKRAAASPVSWLVHWKKAMAVFRRPTRS